MIRLCVMGAPKLAGDDGQSIHSVLAQPKRLALLVYLALAGPGKFRSREMVLALFWPESTDKQARQSLNQALHFLRQSLGADVVVSRGSVEIGVASGLLWCDAVAFDGMNKAGDLLPALDLYEDDLLAGFFTDASPEFDQWLAGERGRLQRDAANSAWKLAELAEREGAAAAAADWGQTAVDISMNDETIARNLIFMLDRVGNRSGALRAYDLFAGRLASEFETHPSAATQAVIAQIRDRGTVASVQPEQPVNEAHIWRSEVAASSSLGDQHRHVSREEQETGARVGNTGSPAWLRTRAMIQKLRWPLFAVGLLVAGIGAVWVNPRIFEFSVGHGRASLEQANIVVRDFGDVGPQNDSLRLSAVLTPAIINQLTGVRLFNVESLRGSDSMPESHRPMSAGPRVLLEGSVVQSAERVRVNIEISDTESGRTIKTAVLEYPSENLLALADSISVQVSSIVRMAVGFQSRLREWAAQTNNRAAYDLMLQANEDRDRSNALSGSSESVSAGRLLWSADSALRLVQQESPEWTEPMIERAGVLESLAVLDLVQPKPDLVASNTSLIEGIRQAQLALARAPNDAAALEALGTAEYWYWLTVRLPADSAHRVRNRAEHNLSAAIAADPNRASALSLLSGSMYMRADYVGAYIAAERAYRADAYLRSTETILDELFVSAYEIKDDTTSKYWCDEIGRRMARGWLRSYCQLRQMATGGMQDRYAIGHAWRIASDAGNQADRTHSVSPDLQMLVAIIIARQGLADSAKAVSADARQRNGADHELLPYVAELQLRLGQRDSATASLVDYVSGQQDRGAGVVRSRLFTDLPNLQGVLDHIQVPKAIRN